MEAVPAKKDLKASSLNLLRLVVYTTDIFYFKEGNRLFI